MITKPTKHPMTIPCPILLSISCGGYIPYYPYY